MPPVFQVHLQVVALVTEEEAEIFQKPIATCAIWVEANYHFWILPKQVALNTAIENNHQRDYSRQQLT